MSSLLKSCKNCRALLPDSLKYIRSDVPVSLTEEEVAWLLANNIRCIIDLRSEEEQQQKPCSLAKTAGFRYHSLPVRGGNVIPASPELVSRSYLNMVDDQMERILRLIRESDCGVLYFCNAGKDRTGVVSALLLLELGADREQIIEDYLLSGENLREMLLAFAAADPSVDLQVITPQRRYMEEFLAQAKPLNK